MFVFSNIKIDCYQRCEKKQVLLLSFSNITFIASRCSQLRNSHRHTFTLASCTSQKAVTSRICAPKCTDGYEHTSEYQHHLCRADGTWLPPEGTIFCTREFHCFSFKKIILVMLLHIIQTNIIIIRTCIIIFSMQFCS